MSKRRLVLFVISVLALLSACTTRGEEAPPTTPVPEVVTEDLDKVIAEAVIEPVRWGQLSFERGGIVDTVLVSEGDRVEAGDVLVKLDTTTADLALLEAEAALAVAKAELAEVQAGPRPEEIAMIEAEISAAQAGINRAVAERDELQAGGVEADVAAAQAQLAQSQNQYWSAKDVYDREGWRLGEKASLQLEAAQAALDSAEAQLVQARQGGQAQLRALNAAVWAASAQRDVKEAQLALTQAGATTEQIKRAEASVQQAEAAVTSARAVVEQLSLKAPFSGTIVQIDVEPGELASSSVPIIVLATLEQLQARTTDLTQMQVVRVSSGQGVQITLDALEDTVIEGTVERIELQAVDNRGDVTYPVLISLQNPPDALRWGMESLVEIDVQ
jgi:multidrug efflux pump subunit AcrA (membrane-fusion protein)